MGREAGGRLAHGISPEPIYKAIHLGFIVAGLAASAGTVLTVARSEGNALGKGRE